MTLTRFKDDSPQFPSTMWIKSTYRAILTFLICTQKTTFAGSRAQYQHGDNNGHTLWVSALDEHKELDYIASV